MNAPTCPTCGNPLPARELRGLCPQCLLGKALAGTTPSLEAAETSPGIEAGGARSAVAGSPGVRLHYFGDYELIDEIARGGMGVVYRARQVSLNRIVAVKMILSGQLAGEAEVKRFRVEAEAAANLQHPHIVAIHEIGEHEGRHYFSMDFIEGKNLAEHAHAQPPGVRETAQLVKQLAEAVHYAHQRGTLHRDLKPQNVLIDAQGQPHITDFGLAKRWDATDPSAPGAGVASELTHTGAIMGSPSYMAPEQAAARFGEIGPATDVYALGAIFYQLLTGQPPHRGATALDTISQVISDEPASPRRLCAELPPDLETVCLKCLEKRPERRYANARLLAEELGRWFDGEPIRARPASVWRKSASWGLRHPWAITGLVALAIVGLSVVTYGLWERTQYLLWLSAHSGTSGGASRRKLLQDLMPGGLILAWGGWTMLTVLVWGDYRLRRTDGGPIGPVRLALCALVVAGQAVVSLLLLAKVIKLFAWSIVPLALLPMISIGLLLGITVTLRFLLQWIWELRARWSGEVLEAGMFASLPRPAAPPKSGFNFWRAMRASAAKDLRAASSGARLRVDGTMFAGVAAVAIAATFAPRTAQPWGFIGAMLAFFVLFGLGGLVFPQPFASPATDRARLTGTRLASGMILLTALALGSALTQTPKALQRAVLGGTPLGAGVGLAAVGVVAWFGRKKMPRPA